MDTARLLRTPGIMIAVAGMFLSGCSTGGSQHDTQYNAPGASARSVTAKGASSATLQPLPAAIPADLKPYYQQKLNWRGCSTSTPGSATGPGSSTSSGFQCTTMRVPLDYNHPSPSTDLRLVVARKPATGPGQRIGSLLVNPGGPGGSAIDYMVDAATSFPAPVRARYDMVGVDPRGVARSEPIECLTNAQMDKYTEVDNTPSGQAQINAITQADKQFAHGCEQHSGKLLGHVSTIESARDMDVLRALLGDAKLNYVGKSYGTLLGATYAGLFPSRAGHLVLDGALDPSLNSLDESRSQAAGFETAFESFAKDCVQQPDCPMGQSLGAANSYISGFLNRLDAHPLPTGQSRPLVEALGTTALLEAMYAKQQWPTLRNALAQANNGDGSGLLALSDAYYERDTSGQYSNLMYANAAVNCLDLPPAAKSPADIEAALPAFRKASPHFGVDFAWMSLSCSSWPVPATGRPERIEAKGAAPIVVIGTTRDPATPYAWAQSLASQLQSARLLTYVGDGHTIYAMGNDCIDTAVNAYLLQDKVPPKGERCSQ
ncbi:alpha/beta hydrolase [Streptomyces sp. RB6PN25]|uniref:Alpha/beta hydrolase n=1 Tax=Streptomyces humicola TaxID=2953240 RepID=A0ABT1PX50_9ACTN|nr:alpha/beta hydrolase [Streptomyces humicola]MCQ4081142.1 alpha/beta hydrolase [Streptomyces humicola]